MIIDKLFESKHFRTSWSNIAKNQGIFLFFLENHPKSKNASQKLRLIIVMNIKTMKNLNHPKILILHFREKLLRRKLLPQTTQQVLYNHKQ